MDHARGYVARDEADHVMPFLGELDEDDALLPALRPRGERLDHLLGRGVDRAQDRKARQELLESHLDLTADHVGREHPEQVEDHQRDEQA